MQLDNKELLIGRHISLASPDYLLGSIKKAIDFYKINSFMVYLSSPRTSFSKNLKDLKVEEFKNYASKKSFVIKNIVVHSSYLANLGDFSNQEKLNWSTSFLKREFFKAREIGLETIVMHPGSSLKLDREKSLFNVSTCLDEILQTVPDVRVCLETMAGSGNQLGKNFDEIEKIIKMSKFPNRIGICLDTCHLYASGYDVKNNFDRILEEVDQKIGIEKVWVLHINDSVFGLGSKKDRHANIGNGHIGFNALSSICHHPSLKKSIKILETPTKNELHEKEIYQIKEFF